MRHLNSILTALVAFPVSNALAGNDQSPLKGLTPSDGLVIQSPIDLLKETTSDEVTVAKNGKILGNFEMTLPLTPFLDGRFTKAAATEELKRTVGSGNEPDPGLYCFMKAPLSSLKDTNRKFRIKKCGDSEAVSSIEGGTTKNFSWSFLGKSNRIAVSSCALQDTQGDAPEATQWIGCIAYKSPKDPSIADVLSAFGLKSGSLSVGDVRSPEELAADARKKEVAERRAAELRRKKECEDQKRDALLNRAPLAEKWSNAIFDRLPKVNDPTYLEWGKTHPEGVKLRDDCAMAAIAGFSSILSGSENPDMPQPKSCDDFLQLWNAR